MVVQERIKIWFEEEAAKILIHINMEDITGSEQVRIHHHELHKKRVVKSSILQLEDGDKIVSGHNDCAAKLIQSAASFLETEINLDHKAQQQLLEEVEPSFTEEDNLALLKPPDKEEILQVIKKANLHAAPGTDGITNYFYLKFFDVIGEHLSQVIKEIFNKESPTTSQKTSIMVFSNKPNKLNLKKIVRQSRN